MALRKVLAPLARRDIKDLADYIGAQDGAAALRLIGRIEKTIELLAAPTSWPACLAVFFDPDAANVGSPVHRLPLDDEDGTHRLARPACLARSRRSGAL